MTASDVISRAKMELEYFNSDKDYLFEMQFNEAVRLFNCQEILVKENECFQLDQNGRWFFPKGFYDVLLITGEQLIQNGTTPVWAPIMYCNQPMLRGFDINAMPPNNVNSHVLTYQKNNNYLQFFGNYSTFNNMFAAYIKYNVDENGTFTIPDEWGDAIFNYICAKFCLSHAKDYAQWQYQVYWEEFLNLKRKYVSESNQKRFKNMKPQLLKTCNTLISGSRWGCGNIFY